MSDKFTKQNVIHQLPAGLLKGDNRTELIGIRETHKVIFMTNGKTKPFATIDPYKKALIFEQMLSDAPAMEALKELSFDEALESYAFCVYGAANAEPDFNENGELQKTENFLCSNNCQCLKWETKNIAINGNKLTPRELEIVKLLASDLADKQLADQLNIKESTLNTHKSHLFEKFQVQSTRGLITKAIANKIIQ